jgi:hypothetical protein
VPPSQAFASRNHRNATGQSSIALGAWKEMLGMTKPILLVTSRYTREVEDRIDRDYNARRNPNQFPFSRQNLLSAAEGADALFITPADRLDSGFFQNISPHLKNHRYVLGGF